MQIWDLENFTPFQAFAGFERDHHARSFWCVWVKATFKVDDSGSVRLSPNQIDLVRAPEVDKAGIMRADNEIILPKDQTDILLTARSAPPAGHVDTKPYDVGVRVGGWQKALEVRPAQVWRKGDGLLALPGADPSVGLHYGNAFGGTIIEDGQEVRHEANPAGTGFVGRDWPEKITAPRLVPKGRSWGGPGEDVAAVALSPIPPFWLSRAERAGTYDTEWQQTRSPLLPKDYDPAFRQSAPPDQRYRGHLRGGEEVVLTGIKWGDGAEAPSFRLPQLNFDVTTFYKGARARMDMTIQTLNLEPGDQRFSLTFMGTHAIGRAADDIDVKKSRIIVSDSSGFTVPADMIDDFYQSTESAPA